MRIRVSDPLPIFRDGLVQALIDRGHRAEVLSGDEDTAGCDAVIITSEAPGTDVDADRIARLVGVDGLLVVALLTTEDPDAHRSALEAGARATVFRDSPFEVVEAALRAARADFSGVPTSVVKAAPAAVLPSEPPTVSEQELAWLNALAAGQAVRRLANAEHRSERDMYRVLRKLYLRLGAQGRVQAIVRAAKWGLLD